MKIQTVEDLDFEDVCMKAATFIDKNSLEYRRAVKRDAERIYNSRFMEQFNKAKETVKEAAWDEGLEEGEAEHGVWYYRNICGEEIAVVPNGNNHRAVIQYMRENGLGHTGCHERA